VLDARSDPGDADPPYLRLPAKMRVSVLNPIKAAPADTPETRALTFTMYERKITDMTSHRVAIARGRLGPAMDRSVMKEQWLSIDKWRKLQLTGSPRCAGGCALVSGARYDAYGRRNLEVLLVWSQGGAWSLLRAAEGDVLCGVPASIATQLEPGFSC
jgi:hypothetical protein